MYGSELELSGSGCLKDECKVSKFGGGLLFITFIVERYKLMALKIINYTCKITRTQCHVSAYGYGMLMIKFAAASLLRKYTFSTDLRFDKLDLHLHFMYKPKLGFLLNYERR